MGARVPDSGYTFVKIPFSQLYKEAYHLLFETFKESLSLNKQEFNIDLDKYLLLESTGFLIVIGVYNKERITGYAVIIADNLLHAKHKYYAKIDAIFIDKKHRSLSLFKSLLCYIETYLKAYNVTYIFISSPAKRRLDKILEYYDYKVAETLYVKELK